jgi:hypothetical protein
MDLRVSHTLGSTGNWNTRVKIEKRLIGESFECVFPCYSTTVSDTLKPNGHPEKGTRTGVWLRNKPTDLSACVSEECGHGEGGVVYDTLL